MQHIQIKRGRFLGPQHTHTHKDNFKKSRFIIASRLIVSRQKMNRDVSFMCNIRCDVI